jgi:hypothetical protein
MDRISTDRKLARKESQPPQQVQSLRRVYKMSKDREADNEPGVPQLGLPGTCVWMGMHQQFSESSRVEERGI